MLFINRMGSNVGGEEGRDEELKEDEATVQYASMLSEGTEKVLPLKKDFKKGGRSAFKAAWSGEEITS